jgi:hypothetical protein
MSLWRASEACCLATSWYLVQVRLLPVLLCLFYGRIAVHILLHKAAAPLGQKPRVILCQGKILPLLVTIESRVTAVLAFVVAEPKLYNHVKDEHQLLQVVGEYLGDMNATSKKPQPLVLFQFALEHVVRISRIISTPGKH